MLNKKRLLNILIVDICPVVNGICDRLDDNLGQLLNLKQDFRVNQTICP